MDAAELPRTAIAQLLGVSRRWLDKLVARRQPGGAGRYPGRQRRPGPERAHRA